MFVIVAIALAALGVVALVTKKQEPMTDADDMPEVPPDLLVPPTPTSPGIPMPETFGTRRVLPFDGIAPPDRPPSCPLPLPCPDPAPKDVVPQEPYDSTPFDTSPPTPLVVFVPMVPPELITPPPPPAPLVMFVPMVPPELITPPPSQASAPTPTPPPAPVAAPEVPTPAPAPAPPPGAPVNVPPELLNPPKPTPPAPKFNVGDVVYATGGLYGKVVGRTFNEASWEWQYSYRNPAFGLIDAREVNLSRTAPSTPLLPI